MIILVNNGDKSGQGCVSQMIIYHTKRGKELQIIIHDSGLIIDYYSGEVWGAIRMEHEKYKETSVV